MRLSPAASRIPAVLLDAGSRPGGAISTAETDGFRFEAGPQSFLSTEPLLKLIEALGLKRNCSARTRGPAIHSPGRQLFRLLLHRHLC